MINDELIKISVKLPLIKYKIVNLFQRKGGCYHYQYFITIKLIGQTNICQMLKNGMRHKINYNRERRPIVGEAMRKSLGLG
jgi:hypothetical protein